MDGIIYIKGNVKFTITLDPGVWIFDDRRIDMHTYFDSPKQQTNELEEYTKSISKHWDREIREGAAFPPTLKSERKFEKEKVLTGSFGIPFLPFLKNAEPAETASLVVIHASGKEIEVPMESAAGLILGFSNKGKPLREDGPVHVYFGDGSNKNDPIKGVTGFFVV